MKIRIMATPAEAAAAVAALRKVLDVVEVDGPRPNRGDSKLVRVYVEVRLPEGGEAR